MTVLACQKWDAVELFAGAQTITKSLRDCGYSAVGLDILHWAEYKQRRLQEGRRMCDGNPMDINGSAGYANLGSNQHGHVM